MIHDPTNGRQAVRLVTGFRGHAAGAVLEVPAGFAMQLARGGIAVMVPPGSPDAARAMPERADANPAAETRRAMP